MSSSPRSSPKRSQNDKLPSPPRKRYRKESLEKSSESSNESSDENYVPYISVKERKKQEYIKLGMYLNYVDFQELP